MEVRLLGPVEVHAAGAVLPLARTGERCVLASLALNPGRLVSVDTFADQVWAHDPPTHAERTIGSYLGAVRRALRRAGAPADCVRNHRPAAYQLTIDPETIDHHRFTRLVAEADRRRLSGDIEDATTLYDQAVSLRQEPPLAGLTSPWAEQVRWAIDRTYVDALCHLYAGWLRAGAHARVAVSVSDLLARVVPTDRLILLAAQGLAGSGQHAAIRDLLERNTIRMRETAGAAPSPELRAAVLRLASTPGAPLEASASEQPSQDDFVRRSAEPRVVMIAHHAGQIHQAAADQHILGQRPLRGGRRR